MHITYEQKIENVVFINNKNISILSDEELSEEEIVIELRYMVHKAHVLKDRVVFYQFIFGGKGAEDILFSVNLSVSDNNMIDQFVDKKEALKLFDKAVKEDLLWKYFCLCNSLIS